MLLYFTHCDIYYELAYHKPSLISCMIESHESLKDGLFSIMKIKFRKSTNSDSQSVKSSLS